VAVDLPTCDVDLALIECENHVRLAEQAEICRPVRKLPDRHGAPFGNLFGVDTFVQWRLVQHGPSLSMPARIIISIRRGVNPRVKASELETAVYS
jgi:hypothetical protein